MPGAPIEEPIHFDFKVIQNVNKVEESKPGRS